MSLRHKSKLGLRKTLTGLCSNLVCGIVLEPYIFPWKSTKSSYFLSFYGSMLCHFLSENHLKFNYSYARIIYIVYTYLYYIAYTIKRIIIILYTQHYTYNMLSAHLLVYFAIFLFTYITVNNIYFNIYYKVMLKLKLKRAKIMFMLFLLS